MVDDLNFYAENGEKKERKIFVYACSQFRVSVAMRNVREEAVCNFIFHIMAPRFDRIHGRRTRLDPIYRCSATISVSSRRS